MNRLTRRQFLKLGVLGSAGVGMAIGLSGSRWWEWSAGVPSAMTAGPPAPWAVEARYYVSMAHQGSLDCAACHGVDEPSLPVAYCHVPHSSTYVKCTLCPHGCVIADGERGRCRTRENRGGVLYTLAYSNPCAVHLDPIEKKPFFHFLPTAPAFSLAVGGCNLRCLYCQNWQISQIRPEEARTYMLSPAEVARAAVEYDAPVVAYTYTEPTVFYEYMVDAAREVRKAGMRNVVISAGYINPDPLRELCRVVDAIKIDLKGFSETFYARVCSAHLEPVLQAIRTIHEAGVHLEVVNLVVPTLNDADDELRALVDWMLEVLGPDVPLHFSRFYPNYRLTNLPPTPVEKLTRAWEMAREMGLHYPYVGNVPDHPGSHTYCPACGALLIRRKGFAVLEYHLDGGKCAFCGEPVAGVWWEGTLPSFSLPSPVGPSDQ